MTNDVTVKLKGDKSDLDAALASSQRSVGDYAGMVKGALVGLAGAFAIKEAFSFAAGLVASAGEAEAAQAKLASVIRATGGAAGYTQDQFNQMAADMHEVTGIGDDTITGMQAVIATFKNIRGETFQEATMAAADMAAVMGGDLVGASQMVAKALNDPAKGIAALTRNGVTFSESQKDMIAKLQEGGDIMGAQKVILAELASEFGGAAADQAQTFNGRVALLWDTLGELGESIGGLLIPALEAILPVGQYVIEFFQDMINVLSEGQEMSTDFSDSWTNYFINSFIDGVYLMTDAFSLLEFMFNNFGNIIERQSYAWMLSFVSVFEELKYWLTEVTPQYLDWFSNNWSQTLYDMGNYLVTVFGNMWTNVVEFFTSMKDYLSGSGGSFEFVALTKGFERTMEELPKIASRQKSETEKYLKGSVDQMDGLLGKSFAETFKKNKDTVDSIFKGEGKPVEVDLEPNLIPFEKEVAEAVKKEKEKADSANKELDKKLGDAKEEETKLGETTGVEDLHKQIQEAAFAARPEQQGGGQFVGEFNAGLMMNEIDQLIADMKNKKKGGPDEEKPGMALSTSDSINNQFDAEAAAREAEEFDTQMNDAYYGEGATEREKQAFDDEMNLAYYGDEAVREASKATDLVDKAATEDIRLRTFSQPEQKTSQSTPAVSTTELYNVLDAIRKNQEAQHPQTLRALGSTGGTT